MPLIFKNRIGYLPYRNTIQFSNGQIHPLDNFDNVCESVKKKANNDGFYYPPVVGMYRERHEILDGKLETFEDLVPNTKRHARLFRMPASHEIQLFDPTNKNDQKKEDGLFITYLVAFIFGVRLQFHDWWFDGRVPIYIQQDFHISHSSIENFIDKAYNIWLNCPEKKLLTNLLYMQTKTQSYEWDWERFFISYMVFDGCYKFLAKTRHISSKTHKDRLKTVLEYFNMKIDMNWIEYIVTLRNDLFHEALWEEGQPGSGSTYAHSAAFHLSKLNSRIVFAILGHRGEYIQSPWWLSGTFVF